MRSPFNDFAAVWIGKKQNIAIGGVSSFITSASILANYLTINPSDIFNFRIVGDTVFADILINYEIGATALTFENNNLIRYFDQASGGISTGFTRYFANSSVFYVTSKTTGRVSSDEMYENSDLKYAFFENADTLRGFRCFAGLTDTRIYIGNLSILDRIVGSSNSPFSGCTNVKVYMPPSAPAILGQGAQFERIDILDTTTPDSLSLTTAETGGTYVRLDGTSIVNAEFYELWIVKNGVYEFIGEIQDSGDKFYLINLEENTNYSIKIATCDQYWNGSGFFEDASKQAFSNVINVTTTTTPALFQNAVAYYKLDETSGQAIDVVNVYNSTLFGGVTQGVVGKIGTAYSFNGVDGRVVLDKNIYNNLTSNNFTFSIWFKTNDVAKTQLIVSDWETSSLDRKLHAFVRGSSQTIRLAFADNGSINFIDSSTISNNTWYFLQIKHNSNGVQEMKLNNVIQGTYTYINAPTLEQEIVLGIDKANSNTFPFDGVLDEVSFINGQTTAAQDSDLYNNGNGTTI